LAIKFFLSLRYRLKRLN